jgi:hypothetical protein
MVLTTAWLELACEGLVHHAVVTLQRGCRIAIEGGSHLRGEINQIDILGMENAVAVMEMMHMLPWAYCAVNCDGGSGSPRTPQAASDRPTSASTKHLRSRFMGGGLSVA